MKVTTTLRVWSCSTSLDPELRVRHTYDYPAGTVFEVQVDDIAFSPFGLEVIAELEFGGHQVTVTPALCTVEGRISELTKYYEGLTEMYKLTLSDRLNDSPNEV